MRSSERKIIRRQLNALYLEYVYATSKHEKKRNVLTNLLDIKIKINLLRERLCEIDPHELKEPQHVYELEDLNVVYCAECEKVIPKGTKAFEWRKQTFCREHCCRLSQFKAGQAKKKTTSGNVVRRIVV